jgi:hypothetical protein
MILLFLDFVQSRIMDVSPVFWIVLSFFGLLGLDVYFGLKKRAPKTQQSPFIISHEDDETQGEKQHCDGYSVGTFYW